MCEESKPRRCSQPPMRRSVVAAVYAAAKNRYFPDEPEGEPADIALLTEIRDLLAQASTVKTRNKPPA
jgi:hypothetical protein